MKIHKINKINISLKEVAYKIFYKMNKIKIKNLVNQLKIYNKLLSNVKDNIVFQTKNMFLRILNFKNNLYKFFQMNKKNKFKLLNKKILNLNFLQMKIFKRNKKIHWIRICC